MVQESRQDVECSFGVRRSVACFIRWDRPLFVNPKPPVDVLQRRAKTRNIAFLRPRLKNAWDTAQQGPNGVDETVLESRLRCRRDGSTRSVVLFYSALVSYYRST
eukprot:6196608-Pleurochrysis_carterae.AAC.6